MRKYLAIGPTNGSFRKWYDNGADLASALLPLNRTDGAALAAAWGYLEGAADIADLTVMELLGQYMIALDVPSGLTADTITDEDIRALWRAKKITSAERNAAIRTYRGGLGASVRREARARCAAIHNRKQTP